MNARSTSRFLYILAKLRPEMWDAIIPHGPKVSNASREYMIAMAIKGFESELDPRAHNGRLAELQKTLVTHASERFAADYDDDNWCATGRPRPGPHPFGFLSDEIMLNPQPLPPKELQREIGGYLLMLSEATALNDVSKELESIGNALLARTT
jgi:hypothetical protein